MGILVFYYGWEEFMGKKYDYAIPLIILIALVIIFVLFSITVISTSSVWVPYVASAMPGNRASQTAYPTYTPLPTYTLAATQKIISTPEFITGYLPNYNMNISIPNNWNIWEVNPRKYDGYGDTCYDYLIDSPDYQQEVKIYVICGAWGSAGDFCPAGVVSIGIIQNTSIVRFPDPSTTKKYIYATSYGEAECSIPGEASVWLKFQGELHPYFITYSYSGNADLELADSIVLSFLHNP
jgi:hypothetical protein